MQRSTCFATLLAAACGMVLNAQTPSLEIGALYECANNQSFKVVSCSGAKDSDQCDVQSYSSGKPSARGNSTRQQVMMLAPNCKAQKVTSSTQPAAAKAGKAAPATGKPALTSCAGKFEGRYAPSNGGPGATIVFRAGKATMSGPLVDPEEVDCLMGGGKIYLRKAGEPNDLPIEINDDGTLETPFGELKKKGN